MKQILMQNRKMIPENGFITLLFVLINVIIIRAGYTGNENWYLALIITLPLLILAITRKKGKTISF
jgi:hypothetical protein